MKIFSQQEIADAYMVLPQDIQKAVSSASVGTEVVAIGNEVRLHIDDLGLLNEEVAFVMLGLIKPTDFESRLVERLSMESSKARNLVQMVNNRIFSPVRASIIALHHDTVEEEASPRTEEPRSVPMSRPVPVAPNPITPKPEMQRANILADIEDVPLAPQQTNQTSFVDNKLTTPVTTSAQKVVIESPKKYSADPYRESTL